MNTHGTGPETLAVFVRVSSPVVLMLMTAAAFLLVQPFSAEKKNTVRSTPHDDFAQSECSPGWSRWRRF